MRHSPIHQSTKMMKAKKILSLSLVALALQACGQKIDGTLTSTHWSPDSLYYVEVYKENIKYGLPGQGGDHSAIIALKKSNGELIHIVDGNSSDQILHRSFYGVKWEEGRNILNYAPARYIEWIDEDRLDMEQMRAPISTYLGYENWQYFKTPELFGDHYYAIGDFFNDPEYNYSLDLAVLIIDSTETVKLLIYEAYNYFHPLEGISFIDLKDDYSWVGNFRAVEPKQPIWSNYVEDSLDEGIREFEETPESEITYLSYHALYLHAGESCGGGFIYWENDQWKWRQQE